MNTQDSSPLGWTSWISLQTKGLSRVFSNTIVQNIISSALSFLYSPTLTSIHDHWKNHSLDYKDLCRQSNVSAFYLFIYFFLWWILSYIEMKQPRVYMRSPSQSPLPPPSPPTPPRFSQCTRTECPSHASNLGW